MADPLSAATSIASLISVGVKTSFQLSQFIESVRAAPGDIRDLAKELTDLCLILKKLQAAFSKGDNRASIQHKELSRDFENVLDSCMDKFIQLQMLVKTHEIKNSDGALARKWKGWRWTFQEKEVLTLKTQLEAHKATLNITLTLATYTDITSVKDSQDRLENAAREIIERIKTLGDDESTAATQANSSYILERYLSSASSVFSSPPSSPVLRPNLGIIAEEEPKELKKTGNDYTPSSLPKATRHSHRSSRRRDVRTKSWVQNVASGGDGPFLASQAQPSSSDSHDPLGYTVDLAVLDPYYSLSTVTTVHGREEMIDLPEPLRVSPAAHAWPPGPPPKPWSPPRPSPPGEQLPSAAGGGWPVAGITMPTVGQIPPILDQPRIKPPQNLFPVKQLSIIRRLSPIGNPTQIPGSAPLQPPPIAGGPLLGLRQPVAPMVLGDMGFTTNPIEILPLQFGANVPDDSPRDLSSILRWYQSRRTQPSTILQTVRNTIHSLNQDFSFSQEANRLYRESAARRQVLREQERSTRQDEYWQYMYNLQAEGKISQGELQGGYSQFEWNEKQKEAFEAYGECEIYDVVVYQRINDKLQQSIRLLTDEYYSNIRQEIPRALAGEDRWTLNGGIELTELLEVWLELWNQTESRYDMAEVASLERNEVFREWEAAYGNTGNSESDLIKVAKEHASKWASEKRDRTNALTVSIDPIIARGLRRERDYIKSVWAAANRSITQVTSLRMGGRYTISTYLNNDTLTSLDILRQVGYPYIQIITALKEVELLGNVWKYKIMLADLRPTNSSISKVKELKNTKDHMLREKYEQEIAIFTKKFKVIHANLKAALDQCVVGFEVVEP